MEHEIGPACGTVVLLGPMICARLELRVAIWGEAKDTHDAMEPLKILFLRIRIYPGRSELTCAIQMKPPPLLVWEKPLSTA